MFFSVAALASRSTCLAVRSASFETAAVSFVCSVRVSLSVFAWHGFFFTSCVSFASACS